MVGMLAIGNGEKCPFCEIIMTKDIKIFDHIYNKHKEKLLENGDRWESVLAKNIKLDKPYR